MTFDEIWKITGAGAILNGEKAHNLYQELIDTNTIAGSLGEIGVYKGQTAKLMRLAMPQKPLHLYDTFKGIVGADPTKDVHTNGEFSDTNLFKVIELVGCDETTYHPGMFPDTFRKYHGPFSFVHSDTDTYFGTMETLRYILPLLQIGGKIMFDDYRWQNCPGVEEAISEFLLTNSIPVKTKEYTFQFVITRT